MIRRLSRILAIAGLCVLSTVHAISATLAELWAERTPCVVAVEFMIEMETDRQTGNACGTVIDDHGTIILPPMAINLRFTPEQLKDFKVFLPGAVTGKAAKSLGTDELTGWHFIRADESQWAEITPVTRFVPSKPIPAPVLGEEVWGLALREKDEDFMPYLLSARVALLNRFPQLTVVAQQEIASPGLPVFNQAGEFIGLALSSFGQTYLQFSRDNPGGMPIMNVNAEESSAFHVADEVLPYFSRIPTNPHGRPKVWLGTFRLESVTPEVAAFLKLENQSAVMVSEVLENSPAEKAGFKERDIIVALDGQPLPKFRPARVVTGFIDREIGRREPGQKIAFTVVRDGQRVELDAVLEDSPKDPREAMRRYFESVGCAVREFVYMDGVYRKEKLSAHAGVVAYFVKANSPAAVAGLRPEDWVKEIDGTEVKTYAQAIELLGAIEADKTRTESVFLVSRGGGETAVLRVKLNR